MLDLKQLAKFSGANLPEENEEPVIAEYDLPDFGEKTVIEESPDEDDEGFVKEPFQRKKGFHQNPAVTLGFVLAGAGIISGLGFLAFGADIKWPTFSSDSSQTDTREKIKPRTGDVTTAAIAGPMGQGFEDDKPDNPFLNPPLQSPRPKTQPDGSKTDSKSNSKVKKGIPDSSPSMAPVIPHTTPVISARPSTVPRTNYSTSYSSYSSPSMQRAQPRSVPLPAPPVTPKKQSSAQSAPVQQVEQKSFAERRDAAIASTSFLAMADKSGGVAVGQPTGVQPNNGSSGSSVSSGPVEPQYLASESSVIDGVPQKLVDRAKKAEGILLQGLAFTPGDSKYLENQEITAEITKPLDSSLPEGTQIIAAIQFPSSNIQSKSAAVRLVPRAIVLNGTEYEIPEGSAVLMGKNGKAFVAKRGGSEFMRSVGGIFKTVLTTGVGTLVSSATGGNILSSVLGGIGGGQGQTNPAEVLYLKERQPIQFSIIRSFQIPGA